MEQRQRAVVTGATTGIGEAITRRLAADGMTVVMVGRDEERLDQARRRVLAAVPDADLEAERADLSLREQVRALADRLVNRSLPDVVISNAAVIADVADLTVEGVQRSLATNHLAPYLLLRRLAEAIGEASARFVVVGADPAGLSRVPVDLDDLGFRTGRGLGPVPSFRPFLAYGRTKNMNAMFVYELARRLAHSRITVNGAHPGIVKRTGLGRDARGALRIFGSLLERSSRTLEPDDGADTPAWLASAPEVEGVTGRFFVRREQVPTAAHTTDVERCARLWVESARLVGLPD